MYNNNYNDTYDNYEEVTKIGKLQYCVEDSDFDLYVVSDTRANIEYGVHQKLGQLCDYIYTTKEPLTYKQQYIKKNLDLCLRIKNISFE